MASASAPSHHATEPARSTSCRLLSLPPEIRNIIYELAFTTEPDAGDAINIMNAQGPSSFLVQTCHQVRSEALAIFTQSWNRYWTTGNFELYSESDLVEGGTKGFAAKLSVSGADEIKKFKIYSGQKLVWKKSLT